MHFSKPSGRFWRVLEGSEARPKMVTKPMVFQQFHPPGHHRAYKTKWFSTNPPSRPPQSLRNQLFFNSSTLQGQNNITKQIIAKQTHFPGHKKHYKTKWFSANQFSWQVCTPADLASAVYCIGLHRPTQISSLKPDKFRFGSAQRRVCEVGGSCGGT